MWVKWQEGGQNLVKIRIIASLDDIWTDFGFIKCFELPPPNSFATDFFKYILAGAAVLAIIQVAIQ